MNRLPTTFNLPPPPRLSMDEYADFVEASLRESNPAHVARQKELEERIRTPFRMAQNGGRQGLKENVLECIKNTKSVRD